MRRWESRITPVSPRVTSTRVNFKFNSLHHICVFMSNLRFMSFNTCIYATDLYFKSIYVSFSLRLTSTRVNSKFDPLIKYVFMSNLHFMSFNICIHATDLYLKVFMERYGDKNCVDFMQIRQFTECGFMFM